jgi:hypothetical protein
MPGLIRPKISTGIEISKIGAPSTTATATVCLPVLSVFSVFPVPFLPMAVF